MRPVARRATPTDIPAISRTLQRAFVDDPVKSHLFGGRAVPEHKAVTFFEAFASVQLRHELVYVTEQCEAAALWTPPGHWKIPLRDVVRHAPQFVRVFGTRLVDNLLLLAQVEKVHPSEPHYYLEFVGADPAHRGKGFGAAVIEPVLERADAEGVGCYLENSKESNIAFYSRLGFEVRETLAVRRGGPTLWLMWRDPR
jgi:ribosomal protein S18 acetylase RimI-like enzyme